MPFSLSHWTNPRLTIATRFKDNDIAYATHGAILAMEALTAIDKPVSHLKRLSLLDYGCGTGRVARVLSKAFGKVYAYDPVKECIDMAKQECQGIIFNNIEYFTDISQVPKADMAICINVIEHLTNPDAEILINHLKEKINGESYIWYHNNRNKTVLDKYLTNEQKIEDSGDDRIVIRGFKFKELQ